MTDFVFTALRLIFLALIYLFVWYVAKGIADYLGLGDPLRNTRFGSRLVFIRSESQSGMHFTVPDSVVLGKSPDGRCPHRRPVCVGVSSSHQPTPGKAVGQRPGQRQRHLSQRSKAADSG